MHHRTTSHATVAGVLDLAAGFLALTGGSMLGLLGLLGSGILAAVPDELPAVIRLVPVAFFGPLALLALLAAVVCFVGGAAALRRSSRGWALAGAVAALVAFAPLGIAALVFTILAEGEFGGAEARGTPPDTPSA